MPIKAILFDAIGTLLYADPDVATVYSQAGSRFGCIVSRDEIQTRFRRAFRTAFAVDDQLERPAAHEHDRRRWRQVVAEVFHEMESTDELFDELWGHFAQPTAWRLFSDVKTAWLDAEQRGMIVGVASNYDDRLRSVAAGHRRLAECEYLFHSSSIGYAKPDPRFFAAITAKLQLESREIVLVGDDWENDYLGALAVGWQAVHLDRSTSVSRRDSIGSLNELFSNV